jgi:hypothetical protein
MSAIGKVLAEAGILPQDAVKQFARWRVPGIEKIDVENPPTPALVDPQQVVSHLDEAMQEKAFVQVKETDLTVLDQYQQTKTEAVLHIEDDQGQSADVPVEVGRLRTGEYIFPWTSEGIEDVMINGFTRLHLGETNSPGIAFKDVRELFFGDDKAFMVCTPATRLGDSNGHR